MTNMEDATLENFFSRPLRLATLAFPVGSTLSTNFTTINPWNAYFTNRRISNRISNFNLMRAKLCIKIVINGNGFHYGRLLASYRPLHNDDELRGWRPLVPQSTVQASQRMHVWLDPTKSQGGTLCLPFVWYNNALNLPLQEFNQMGELDIGMVAPLSHANGGTDNVDVSIFAWAEDVELSMPTSSDIGGLLPQSSKRIVYDSQMAKDEYEKDGAISAPATVLSRVAGALSAVPMIGKYAMATQMAASTVASVARMFGMSRPPVLADIQPYRPTYAGNMANTNIPDSTTKLTLDAKQELSIDPSIIGVGSADEMAITSIVQRESYLTSFQWAPADAQGERLWDCGVTPTLVSKAGGENMLTPMALCAIPFKHWRGTVKFRFQICASNFHKGRLKVVYEPHAFQEQNELIQYTHVVDLANERDFSMECKWSQQQSFLPIRDPIQNTVAYASGGTGTIIPYNESYNGYISIHVMNELTTPAPDTDPVTILVSVSGGDDMEFVNPDDNRTAFLSFYEPQSSRRIVYDSQAGSTTQADEDLTMEESKPEDTMAKHQVAADMPATDHTLSVYFGDPVTSIRQVLKRYMYHTAYAVLDNPSANGAFLARVVDFPQYRGYITTGGNLTSASTPSPITPYVYANMTMINWFTPAFLARRGGLRIKYMYESEANQNLIRGPMSVNRVAFSLTNQIIAAREKYFGGTNSAVTQSALGSMPTYSFSGAHFTTIEQNPVLEVELPYYSNERFRPGRTLSVATTGKDSYHELRAPKNIDNTVLVHRFMSVGEDFGLFFFQAAPSVWRQENPAPSSV